MAIYNVIIIFFMIYYTFFFIGLATKKNRNKVQEKNTELDEMRKIPVKTIEEQKKFINTKYPRTGKFKFTWKWLGKVLVAVIISIFLFRGYNQLFNILHIEINLWQVVLIIILFPILMNLVLRIFDLQSDDLTVFFR